MSECYKESYEDHIKKTDFLENRLHLKDKTCCDKDSCNKLTMDYQKLMYKCHDVYIKKSNKMGLIDGKSICDELEENRNKFNAMGDKMGGGYHKRNSKNSSKKTRKSVRFSVKSPDKSKSRGSKTTKKKKNKTQNKKRI